MIPRPAADAIPTPDAERLADLCLELTAIPSPTGRERSLATWLGRRLEGAGLGVELQVFDTDRANVVARIPGAGDGPSVMLYSPIDTAFPMGGDVETGSLGPDVPATIAGPASRSGDWIIGPGAENPKGFATCVVAAAESIAASGVSLKGDVIVALTAGGQPTLGRADDPGSDGLGRGCRELFARAPRPDFAVVAKPGDAVSWSEAGIAVFEVRVFGDLGYTGIRHRGHGRHAVRDAARLVERLEAWFPVYTRERRTEIVSPQGAVTAVRGGWPDRPAFLTPVCDLLVDLRTAPDDSLDDVEEMLRRAVSEAGTDLESDVEIRRLGGFEGGSTDAESWIVRSAIRAWEARTGRAHVPATETSGVTDASILRAFGIPVARVGMPRPESPYPGFSMGAVSATAMTALSRTLIDVAFDTCGRTHAEIANASIGGTG